MQKIQARGKIMRVRLDQVHSENMSESTNYFEFMVTKDFKSSLYNLEDTNQISIFLPDKILESNARLVVNYFDVNHNKIDKK